MNKISTARSRKLELRKQTLRTLSSPDLVQTADGAIVTDWTIGTGTISTI